MEISDKIKQVRMTGEEQVATMLCEYFNEVKQECKELEQSGQTVEAIKKYLAASSYVVSGINENLEKVSSPEFQTLLSRNRALDSILYDLSTGRGKKDFVPDKDHSFDFIYEEKYNRMATIAKDDHQYSLILMAGVVSVSPILPYPKVELKDITSENIESLIKQDSPRFSCLTRDLDKMFPGTINRMLYNAARQDPKLTLTVMKMDPENYFRTYRIAEQITKTE